MRERCEKEARHLVYDSLNDKEAIREITNALLKRDVALDKLTKELSIKNSLAIDLTSQLKIAREFLEELSETENEIAVAAQHILQKISEVK